MREEGTYANKKTEVLKGRFILEER